MTEDKPEFDFSENAAPLGDQVEAVVSGNCDEQRLQEAKSYLGYALDMRKSIDLKIARLQRLKNGAVKAWIDAAKAEITAGGNGEDAYNEHRSKCNDRYCRT